MGKSRDFAVEHESGGAPEKARDSASQRQAFIDAARELGCDEDETAFRDKLRVIARQKPKDEPKLAKAVHKKARQPNG